MDQTAPHPQPDALPPLARNAALRAAGIGIALVLSGCATYHPLPLGPGHGASSVDRLSAPTMAMPLPMLPTHRFDPSDGLDATEVAMLAVVNSPELRLKRDALGIARAQAFAAGLLPDPQLALSADFPRQSGAGLNTAYSLGLSEDITALLTRSSRKAAARSQASQVNLDLLWAEWQTVAQARLMFDQVSSLRLQQSRLEQEQAALMARWKPPFSRSTTASRKRPSERLVQGRCRTKRQGRQGWRCGWPASGGAARALMSTSRDPRLPPIRVSVQVYQIRAARCSLPSTNIGVPAISTRV